MASNMNTDKPNGGSSLIIREGKVIEAKSWINMLIDASLVVEQKASLTEKIEKWVKTEVVPKSTKKRISPAKWSLKAALNLKANKLVDRFSSDQSNEMAAQYIYSCRLGGKCTFTARAYRAEQTATKSMAQHLKNHLNELIEQYPDPEQQNRVMVFPGKIPYISEETKKPKLTKSSSPQSAAKPTGLPLQIKLEPTENNIETPQGNLDRQRDRRYGTTQEERDWAEQILQNLESQSKSLSCQICRQQFTAMSSLTTHYRSHAGHTPYQCDECDSSFTRAHSLRYHKMKHANQVRFTCDECGSGFRHPSHFREHLRRHTNEEPFECPRCHIRFKTRNTYKRHLKAKHEMLLTRSNDILLRGQILDFNNNSPPSEENAPPNHKGLGEQPENSVKREFTKGHSSRSPTVTGPRGNSPGKAAEEIVVSRSKVLYLKKSSLSRLLQLSLPTEESSKPFPNHD